MKFIIAALALAATVFATPAEKAKRGGECTPGTYSCTPNNGGWRVCDTSSHWEFGGSCPPNTVCVFFPPSESPYCVPPGFQIP